MFLQGNEISKVEGIQGLQELRELVLDQNKIKVSVRYICVQVHKIDVLLKFVVFTHVFRVILANNLCPFFDL